MSPDLFIEIAGKIVSALAVWPITMVIKSYLDQRRLEESERVERAARYVRRDLDRLKLAITDGDRVYEEELRESIRDAGIRAHDEDGVRGMYYLIRAIVKGYDDRADFYEAKIDKIWDLIGYENGKSSRRGVWVA